MPFLSLDVVGIELLIEGKRSELHAKITGGEYSQCSVPSLVGTPSEFFVLDIRPVDKSSLRADLVDDESPPHADPIDSKFILHVVHNNLNLYYYIFEFKGFI